MKLLCAYVICSSPTSADTTSKVSWYGYKMKGLLESFIRDDDHLNVYDIAIAVA